MAIEFFTQKRYIRFPLIYEIKINLSDDTEYYIRCKLFKKDNFSFDYNGERVDFRLDERHFCYSTYIASYGNREIFKIKKGLFDKMEYNGVAYRLRNWKGFDCKIFGFDCHDSLLSLKLFQCMLKGTFDDRFKLESLILIFYLISNNRLNDGG